MATNGVTGCAGRLSDITKVLPDVDGACWFVLDLGERRLLSAIHSSAFVSCPDLTVVIRLN